MSPKETEIERVEQLFGHFVHEERKGKMQLADCQPDSADDPQGCGFLSDQTLPECPFCGKGGEVVARPKEVPHADRDIELNVKMAAAKPETKPKVAKITSKDVKKKKEERGEKVEDKPVQPPAELPKLEAIVGIDPGVVALDLPSESAGGTAADLDRLSTEIDADLRSFDQAKGLINWRVGKRLAEIRDKKLWTTLRHEDGNPVYRTFHAFVLQRFNEENITPDHAMLMIRIAGELTVEQAQSLGITKAKAILDANNARNSEPITSAQKDELILLAPKMSVAELKARIKRMQLPQIAASAPVESSASNREDDDLDDDDLDDEDDDDSDDEDDGGPESVHPAKPAVKQPQMTAVTFDRKEFEVPLYCKGTQTKPAKKISDEPHATVALPGGTKMILVQRIGDEGQLVIDVKIVQPF